MTKGQVEAKISEIISKFEMEYMGRGPKQIRTKVLEDMIIVRLMGFLTPAEQRLAENNNGVELIKKVRTILFESAEKYFKTLIYNVIDVDIISIHSDVSTRTGEKIILLTFSENIEEKLNR